jgi:DNA-binding response OmpR family regulator
LILIERTAKRRDRAIDLLPREFRLLEHMMRSIGDIHLIYTLLDLAKLGVDDVQRTAIAVQGMAGKRLMYRDSGRVAAPNIR